MAVMMAVALAVEKDASLAVSMAALLAVSKEKVLVDGIMLIYKDSYKGNN